MLPAQDKDFTRNAVVLAVSLELSKGSWKLGLLDSTREKPAINTVSDDVPQKRLNEAVAVIEATKLKWHLLNDVRVVIVLEAGQDGFWIARELEKRGYEALVIDPASIPVERQARRAKTDRLYAIKLVMCLRAWLYGERNRMHVIRMPSKEAEAQRHLVRDRGEMQKECGQHRDRIRKLLRTVGCWDNVDGDFAERLAQGKVLCHDGTALAPELHARLTRECERLALAERQLRELEKVLVKQLPEPVQERITGLKQLKAIGDVGAMRLVLELFWRKFDNRRVRALLIEMAWMWLRYQPKSAIAKWFEQRCGGSGPNKRNRRIAIVAVARRLAIALWRYLEHGEIPEGAEMKPA